jgi:hypothetical protein
MLGLGKTSLAKTPAPSFHMPATSQRFYDRLGFKLAGNKDGGKQRVRLALWIAATSLR